MLVTYEHPVFKAFKQRDREQGADTEGARALPLLVVLFSDSFLSQVQ